MANKKVSQLTSKPSVLTTDLLPIADPSTGQLFKTTVSSLGAVIGSAVASVNGLVGVVVLDTDDIQELASPTNKWFTDTRARAALSSSSPLAYNSGTGVFSIPAATSSQNGYLTSTDWSTFNNKVSTSRTLTINGTAYDLSADRSWSVDSMVYPGAGIPISTGTAWGTSITNNSANWNTAYGWGNHAGLYLPIGGGTLTGNLTLDTGSNKYIQIGSAASYYYKLRAYDNDFEIIGGADAFTALKIYYPNGAATFSNSVTATSFVKTSGTSSQFLKADGSVDSSTYLTTASAAAQYQPLGSYMTGSGESSRLGRWTSTSNLSVAQIWDDGTNIGIGQAPGAFKLDVTGTLRVTGAATFSSSVTASSFVKSSGTSGQFLKADGSVDSSTYLTTSSAAAQYQPIGTYVAGSGSSSRLARWISSSDLSVAQIWDDGTNVGIGQAPGSFKLDVTGTVRITSTLTLQGANNSILSGNELRFYRTDNGIYTRLYDAGSSFVLDNRNGNGFSFQSAGTNQFVIASTGVATFSNAVISGDSFRALSSGVFRLNTNTDGVLGYFIRSGTWKGTTENNLGFATDGAYGISFFTNGTTTEKLHLTNGGNLIVGNGTTDAGFKLDVNGSGRFSSGLTSTTANFTGDVSISANLSLVTGTDRQIIIGSSSNYNWRLRTRGDDLEIRMADTLAAVKFYYPNGAATFNNTVTATAFFESSDKTIKTLIEDNYQAKGIETITPKLYLKNGVEELGYFAQDVKPILPSAVTTGENGLLNLSYREVHTAKIARLEKEIEELKAKLN